VGAGAEPVKRLGLRIGTLLVRPWARRLFRRLAPFTVHTGVAVKGPDGHFRGFSTKSTRVKR
jgi:hypothetical protein